MSLADALAIKEWFELNQAPIKQKPPADANVIALYRDHIANAKTQAARTMYIAHLNLYLEATQDAKGI